MNCRGKQGGNMSVATDTATTIEATSDATRWRQIVLEGICIIALAKFDSNPWAFIILSCVVFLAWGEVYSLFSATSADAFGTKHIGTIYGVLYCAKGVGALLVPIGNLIMEATGTWSTVLYAVAAMDITAAVCAVLVLRPLLRRHNSEAVEA